MVDGIYLLKLMLLYHIQQCILCINEVFLLELGFVGSLDPGVVGASVPTC